MTTETKMVKLPPSRASWGILACLAVWAICGCGNLSPKNDVSATPSVEAGDGSTVTTITFQSVAGKAGWLATPLTLAGWIVATLKARRRERAADDLILAIERCDGNGQSAKRLIERKGDRWIDERVKRLTKVKS